MMIKVSTGYISNVRLCEQFRPKADHLTNQLSHDVTHYVQGLQFNRQSIYFITSILFYISIVDRNSTNFKVNK